MKTLKSNSSVIKTNFTLVICALALISAVVITSCKKKTTESTPPETTITNDDAADVVASSIGTGGHGSTSSISDAAKRTKSAGNAPTPCLFSLDSTFTLVNPTGSYATYNYNSNYKYQMYCTSLIPTSIAFSLTTSGSLTLPRMTVSANASGTSTLTGILPPATSYSLNGSYVRSGSATFKIRAKNSFSYQLNLNFSNLSIDKTTYVVQSGTATANVTATNSTGKTFNFTGTLTYVSATTANLVIDGKTYVINLTNCEAN